MGRLNGKIAFVTGGASGLGEAMVRCFAAEGAAVVIADIDETAGGALARQLDGARFIRPDVTQEQQWLAAFATCERVDVLVNNAGITTYGSIEDVSLEMFRHEFEVDVVGVFLGCKHVIPLMKGAGGSIINMSSLCGVRAQAELAAYDAAKAAVTHLTKSIALHCAAQRYGIRCNSIHPGTIDTPIVRKVLAQVENPDQVLAGWIAGHPLARLGRPEEVAAMALYLASDESAFTTGAEFRVDGGASI